ncbi:hypothetical protein ACOME3_007451 [Neoechinorhynchus agilis]
MLGSEVDDEKQSDDERGSASTFNFPSIPWHSDQSSVVNSQSKCIVRPEDWSICSSGGKYVKLNVGGQLFLTSADTLLKQDGMLRAMFSGAIDSKRDSEGWVLIDRDGRHFGDVLNYLRDGNNVVLPCNSQYLQELRQEADYYCLSGLIELIDKNIKGKSEALPSDDESHIIMVSSRRQANQIIANSSKPVIKLMVNRHNNKYSYTSTSDEMLMRNMELFDRLSLKLNKRLIFIKEVTGSEEICCWSFFAFGQKLTDISCTSIVYSTERKQNKVEFPEVKIYDETLNALVIADNNTDPFADKFALWEQLHQRTFPD